MHKVSLRRGILASITGVIAILQFVKVVTVQGPPRHVAMGYVVGSIYFAHWFVHELLAFVIRFTPTNLDNWDEYEFVTLGLYLRPDWYRRENPRLQIFFSISLAIASGVLAVSMGATDLRLGALDVSEWVRIAGDGLFLVVPYILLIVISHDLDSLVYDWAEAYVPWGALNWWYGLQAIQTWAFLLIYYLCMYDSSQTHHPRWTDWLGKI